MNNIGIKILRFVATYLLGFCFNSLVSWLFFSLFLAPESWSLTGEATQLTILGISLVFGMVAAIPMAWFAVRIIQSETSAHPKSH